MISLSSAISRPDDRGDVAVLGLLALVIYATALRRKEIGVRKSDGAGVGSLVILLSRVSATSSYRGVHCPAVDICLVTCSCQELPLNRSASAAWCCVGLLLLIGLRRSYPKPGARR